MRKENGRIKGQVTYNLEEACELVEAGFEYVTDVDSFKIFCRAKVNKLIEK